MSCKNDSASVSTYDHGLLEDVEEADDDPVDEPPLDGFPAPPPGCNNDVDDWHPEVGAVLIIAERLFWFPEC